MNKDSRLIFSQNSWKEIQMPKGYDPSWNSADKWYYATMLAAAFEKGFSHTRAEILAEAAVNKRLYPGLVYDKLLEQDIVSISRE